MQDSPFLRIFLLLALAAMLAGCGDSSGNGQSTDSADEPLPATPDTAVQEPVEYDPNEPLAGNVNGIPEVFIVPARQPKEALAAFLYTTVRELDRVNPNLPADVTPGTLIVIPPVYSVAAGETLSSIADATGHSEELLQEANPKLSASGALAEGTLLAVPALYIVNEEIPLTAAAGSLGIDDETLLSANPSLAANDSVRAGTVLVVPPQSEE